MLEILKTNSEWVLSGIGVWMLGSIVSFISVVITLLWKSRQEKRKSKQLKISQALTIFSIPNAHKKIDNEYLSVSYKDVVYRNLCMYTVDVTNIGIKGIDNQKIHFVFPKNSKIVDVVIEKNLNSISIEHKNLVNADVIEDVCVVDRLESGDECKISYLVDTIYPNEIKCAARGVDDILYVKSGSNKNFSDIEAIVYLIATYITLGAIPVLSSLLRGFVVLAAMPFVIRIIRQWRINEDEQNAKSVIKINCGDNGAVNFTNEK